MKQLINSIFVCKEDECFKRHLSIYVYIHNKRGFGSRSIETTIYRNLQFYDNNK